MIQKASQKASALTRQLLAVSRKQTLRPQVLDLNQVIRDLEKMLRRLIGEHIVLQVELDPELGPVECDPEQVEQILLNLTINARDVMPTGGALSIRTTNHQVDEESVLTLDRVEPGVYSMLTVRDTGPGIPEEAMDRIFDPFFTTKAEGKGTGLGLSTVYGIVRQSGGHISVYNEFPGATFKIAFPRSDKPLPVAADDQPIEEPEGGQERILLVEDERDVRSVLVRILRMGGYDVTEASSGPDAIAITEREGLDFDILVTDVVMPEMNGRQLSEHLSALRPDLKVLFLSGYTDDILRDQGVSEGQFNLLQKPFQPEVLLTRVREILDGD